MVGSDLVWQLHLNAMRSPGTFFGSSMRHEYGTPGRTAGMAAWQIIGLLTDTRLA